MYIINLEWTIGSTISKSSTVDSVLTVGRNTDCTFCINDPQVSRQHASIRSDANGVYIKNISETSDIYKGTLTLKKGQEAPLANGDTFKVGPVTVTAKVASVSAGIVFNVNCVVCGKQISSTEAICPWCGGNQNTEAGYTMA